jgi:uncharacterized membrane protein
LTRNIDFKSGRNVYVTAVAIALLIASVLLVYYYVALQPAPVPYFTINYLDSQKGTNYPEFVVAGVNSTFSLYVNVENHSGKTVTNAQVQVKVTPDSNPSFPVNANATQTFTGTVKNGATWQNIATVSLNQPGDWLVVFELWTPNSNGNGLQFSGDYVTLNVEVAAA